MDLNLYHSHVEQDGGGVGGGPLQTAVHATITVASMYANPRMQHALIISGQ